MGVNIALCSKNSTFFIRNEPCKQEQTMGKILRKLEKGLEKLTERYFSTEAEMEKFVMNNLELLLGDEIEPSDPRKWLIIKNQLGLPSKSTGSTYSIDLVLVDQDAILTLVEFKKQSNSQILREVIGQVLDYSTNVVMHWTSDYLKEQYENELKKAENGTDPYKNLCTNFSLNEGFVPAGYYSDFWARIKSNIQEHRMRLLIVSERLPMNLAQTISYLNEEFRNMELLGIEIQPYSSESVSDIELFAPNLVGISRNKQLILGFRHTRETFMEEFQKQVHDPVLISELVKVFDWIDNHTGGYKYRFDLNQKKRFYIYYDSRIKKHEFCSIDIQGKVTFYPTMGFPKEQHRKKFEEYIMKSYQISPSTKGNFEVFRIDAEKLIEVFNVIKEIVEQEETRDV
jgi:hypothetical protein